MRKIIITFISTIFMIAPFEKLKGQREPTIMPVDFLAANVLTGANATLSLGLWRLEPFFQFGQYLRVFADSVTIERYRWDGVRTEYRLQGSTSMQTMNIGARFRITDRDYIKAGLMLDVSSGFDGHEMLWLGYVRREYLSQRTNVELSVLLNPWFLSGYEWFAGINGVGFDYDFIAFGARLNYEIFTNFYLTAQLMYSRRFNVSERNNFNDILTRNHINFSIGIHYHIPIPIFGTQQRQVVQRPQRQRVAPHHRALPCPPGQMRHLRSWDRPSSVFNHPSGR